MAELDARKQTILRAIIVEYINGAEPIASEQLALKYDFGVRSATIRNEMAEMSDLGFLEQPHTSAGRIPSDLGYRYYVDRLIVTRAIEDSVQRQVKQGTNEGDALQGLLRDTAKLLSRLTHLLAIATTIRDRAVTVRTAVVSALGPQQALLVLVLSNGHVENRLIDCPAGLTLQDVGAANELLSAAAGKTVRSLLRTKSPTGANPAVDKLLSTLWGAIRQAARDLTRGTVLLEGEEFMFFQPEFASQPSTLSSALEQLLSADIFFEALADEAPQVVTIGKENREPMQKFSVVRNSYYVAGEEAGILAVIGPTRMDYETNLPLISFTAQALSGSLNRFFG